MNASAQPRKFQPKQFQKHAEQIDSYEFFNLLTSPELFDIVESNLPEHRERMYPPTETLSLFLSQAMSADRSCQNAVNTCAVKRRINGFTFNTNTGSYCKARQRLPTELIKTLVRHSGQTVGNVMPSDWLWQDRPVKLIDGTTVTMPDTERNQAVYPQLRSQEIGLGFPICRIVGVVCLSSGCILDAAMGPCKGKGSGEQSLLREILDVLNEGDVVLGDALYCSYFLLAELQRRQVDAVFEQHGSRKMLSDFRKGEKLGEKDHIITYVKPAKRPEWLTQEEYDQVPNTIKVRELRVGHKILVTTLLSAKRASKTALKLLYKNRWHVELDFRNLKTTMGMESFSCKTPAMVEKEMWVYFLAYNLIRMVMAQSAKLADVLPRNISFKHSLQIWQAFRNLHDEIEESIHDLCMLIAQRIVGNRPGRVEPRAIKRRPKPYPLLMKNRVQARNEIRKSGHPKKQK